VTIPRLFLGAPLFAMTILWWYGALALEDAAKRQVGLLPPPNQGAQVMGYSEGLLCLALGIRVVARNLRKSK